MGQKYHINKHGVPAPCYAIQGKCPLGGDSGEDNHYNSEEDAAAAAHEMHAKENGLVPEIDSIEENQSATKYEETLEETSADNSPNGVNDSQNDVELPDLKDEKDNNGIISKEKFDSIKDKKVLVKSTTVDLDANSAHSSNLQQVYVIEDVETGDSETMYQSEYEKRVDSGDVATNEEAQEIYMII